MKKEDSTSTFFTLVIEGRTFSEQCYLYRYHDDVYEAVLVRSGAPSYTAAVGESQSLHCKDAG